MQIFNSPALQFGVRWYFSDESSQCIPYAIIPSLGAGEKTVAHIRHWRFCILLSHQLHKDVVWTTAHLHSERGPICTHFSSLCLLARNKRLARAPCHEEKSNTNRNLLGKQQNLEQQPSFNLPISAGKYPRPLSSFSWHHTGYFAYVLLPSLALVSIFSSYGNGARPDRLKPVSTTSLKRKAARRYACLQQRACIGRRCWINLLLSLLLMLLLLLLLLLLSCYFCCCFYLFWAGSLPDIQSTPTLRTGGEKRKQLL